MGLKVRKSNEITPGDIGFVNLSGSLQKNTKCWCHEFKKTGQKSLQGSCLPVPYFIVCLWKIKSVALRSHFTFFPHNYLRPASDCIKFLKITRPCENQTSYLQSVTCNFQ